MPTNPTRSSSPGPCRARQGRIKTTSDLADAVRGVLAGVELADRDKDTQKTLQRCFQALRIEVNREFDALDTFLSRLPRCLKPGARVAVLTFHSGEETRVLQAFSDGLAGGSYREVSRAPIRPSTQERYDNPRSKSARLHWAVK